jgi:hypothetical protein
MAIALISSTLVCAQDQFKFNATLVHSEGIIKSIEGEMINLEIDNTPNGSRISYHGETDNSQFVIHFNWYMNQNYSEDEMIVATYSISLLKLGDVSKIQGRNGSISMPNKAGVIFSRIYSSQLNEEYTLNIPDNFDLENIQLKINISKL